MPRIVSVNIARETVPVEHADRPTAFRKRPVSGPVDVRAPGAKRDGLGSGLVGDLIGDHRHHGGDGQAVYAVASERLDEWARRLDRALPPGSFGENLTTAGLDVDGAELGEQWRVGGDVVLEVSGPRIPCRTFRGEVGERGWLKSFVADGRPGAYLRVVTPGRVCAQDRVEVVHRPGHGVTIASTFRAVLLDARALPGLLAAGEYLDEELRAVVASGRTYRLTP